MRRRFIIVQLVSRPASGRIRKIPWADMSKWDFDHPTHHQHAQHPAKTWSGVTMATITTTSNRKYKKTRNDKEHTRISNWCQFNVKRHIEATLNACDSIDNKSPNKNELWLCYTVNQFLYLHKTIIYLLKDMITCKIAYVFEKYFWELPVAVAEGLHNSRRSVSLKEFTLSLTLSYCAPPVILQNIWIRHTVTSNDI